MSAVLEIFLNQRLLQPPVSAWSARLADQSTLTRCCDELFAAEQVEHVLNALILAANQLCHIQPLRFCWAFERAKIYLAVRGDGACLSVFVENQAGADLAEVESALEEFAVLKF